MPMSAAVIWIRKDLGSSWGCTDSDSEAGVGEQSRKHKRDPAREHIALKDKNTLCSEKLTLSRELWAVCHWFSQLLKQNICLVEIFQKAPTNTDSLETNWEMMQCMTDRKANTKCRKCK